MVDSIPPDPAPLDSMRHWLQAQALPKWAITGFDPQFGGFRERLDLQAQPLASSPPYRLVTQARQIYVFSHAALLGWFPTGRDLAAMATETMLRRYRGPDAKPGLVFSVDPDGGVADARRDTYAHAFALYALAWAYKLTNDRALEREARAILELFDTDFAAPGGGLLNGADKPAGPRLQNPHMHLFEAMLAWYDATGDARFLARAGEMFGLFTTRFWQPGTASLSEYFDSGLAPAEGDIGRVFEPGHHFEWAWLLRNYARVSDRDTGRYARGLYDTGLAGGLLPDGRVMDEVLPGAGPTKASTRLWPHTELAKAAATEYQAGDATARATCMAALAQMRDHFCRDEYNGGWIDHLDREGQPMVGYMPATSLYHVFLAVAEADRVFGKEE